MGGGKIKTDVGGGPNTDPEVGVKVAVEIKKITFHSAPL